MSEHIFADDYEVQLHPDYPQTLQITNLKTQATLDLSSQEAIDLLMLMYRYREELHVLKFGH